jgi:hypothetical protein
MALHFALFYYIFLCPERRSRIHGLVVLHVSLNNSSVCSRLATRISEQFGQLDAATVIRRVSHTRVAREPGSQPLNYVADRPRGAELN